MKYFKSLLAAVLLSYSAISFSDGHGHPIFTPMEPQSMGGEFTKFVKAQSAFWQNGPFEPKMMYLMSLSAAAGMKCEYCIVATTGMAMEAGATEEEVKAAVMVAGIMALNSTMLYGNQFDLEKLKKMFAQ